MEKDYAVKMSVSDFSEVPFDYIKQHLARELSEKLFIEMIDSGNHHVLKIDMLKTWSPHDYHLIEYCLRVRHSVAREQNVVIAVAPEVMYEGKSWERVCFYCGNALRLDDRGGCNACGSPNGGYK